jgi:hypothetical protein
MTDFPFIKSLLLLPALALSTQATADLKPMDDTALEGTVGQAYIQMDSYVNANNSDQVSRITFGQDIKIQANADSLILGDLTGSAGGIDIAATNFSLGYIDTANNNTIVPFEFSDPYFEWATDASNNLTGFRVGFGEAQGILQMDLTSFSGNIDMMLNGATTSNSSLFTIGTGGVQTNSQATHIGIDGSTCTGDASSTNCVSLANIQSLSVADEDGSSTADFFLSFQKTSSSWLTGGLSGVDYQDTTQGFFMNIPTNNELTIANGSSGTNGLAVEFIDRGVGRWNTP